MAKMVEMIGGRYPIQVAFLCAVEFRIMIKSKGLPIDPFNTPVGDVLNITYGFTEHIYHSEDLACTPITNILIE